MGDHDRPPCPRCGTPSTARGHGYTSAGYACPTVDPALAAMEALAREVNAVASALAAAGAASLDGDSLAGAVTALASERDARHPTDEEGDAYEGKAPAFTRGECFVPGGWTGRRCRVCGRWEWGGPTVHVACEAAERMTAERDAAVAGLATARTEERASIAAWLWNLSDTVRQRALVAGIAHKVEMEVDRG